FRRFPALRLPPCAVSRLRWRDTSDSRWPGKPATRFVGTSHCGDNGASFLPPNLPMPLPLSPASLDRRLSIAPMMDWTTREFRYLLRLITRHTLLYTEMVVAQAVIHGNRERLLKFDAAEHPVALQLGGSDPALLAKAAHIAEDYGYDEINLNVGCPSDRVQQGKIGAVLMAEPALVAECVAAMQQAVRIPVTVKTRIGIDDRDDYAFLHTFIDQVRAAGCRTFII